MFFNEEKNSLQQRYSQRNNQASLSSILQSIPHSNIVVYASLHKPKPRCTFSGNYRVHVSPLLAGIFKRPNYPFTMLNWERFRRTLCSIKPGLHIRRKHKHKHKHKRNQCAHVQHRF